MAQSEEQRIDSAYQDNFLLQLLQINDFSLKELETELPMARSAIADRIARLKNDGVILRMTAVLEPKKVGITHQDAVLLRLADPKPESEAALKQTINTMEEVHRAQVIEGSDFDVLLSLANQSADAREQTLRRLLDASFVADHLVLPLPGRVLKEDIGLPVYIK